MGLKVDHRCPQCGGVLFEVVEVGCHTTPVAFDPVCVDSSAEFFEDRGVASIVCEACRWIQSPEETRELLNAISGAVRVDDFMLCPMCKVPGALRLIKHTEYVRHRSGWFQRPSSTYELFCQNACFSPLHQMAAPRTHQEWRALVDQIKAIHTAELQALHATIGA